MSPPPSAVRVRGPHPIYLLLQYSNHVSYQLSNMTSDVTRYEQFVFIASTRQIVPPPAINTRRSPLPLRAPVQCQSVTEKRAATKARIDRPQRSIIWDAKNGRLM